VKLALQPLLKADFTYGCEEYKASSTDVTRKNNAAEITAFGYPKFGALRSAQAQFDTLAQKDIAFPQVNDSNYATNRLELWQIAIQRAVERLWKKRKDGYFEATEKMSEIH
jgi:hypothetical protein